MWRLIKEEESKQARLTDSGSISIFGSWQCILGTGSSECCESISLKETMVFKVHVILDNRHNIYLQEMKSKMCDNFQRIIFRYIVTTQKSCSINSVPLLQLEDM